MTAGVSYSLQNYFDMEKLIHCTFKNTQLLHNEKKNLAVATTNCYSNK